MAKRNTIDELLGEFGRPEPETRSPKERAIDQLERIIKENTETSKVNAQHAEDGKALLEFIKNGDEQDPVMQALLRIVFAGQGHR